MQALVRWDEHQDMYIVYVGFIFDRQRLISNMQMCSILDIIEKFKDNDFN